ncbi:large ATP-binding protein [Streptomyces sp. CC0208]|uniref:large ATP-binding protein n=1 Tax=Streptomyces sp. CC0208 TaxID=2306165 RepID=UPI000E4FDE0B|nr:large ATP-binding protein [Streptomyces sp. CC0208]
MVPVYRYAVSYAHGRDEAWVARFLDELRRRLDAADGPRFRRLVPPAAPTGGRDEGSYGVGTADIVLALCSPAYFNEGPAQRDWAVLALRRSLGQARTGVAPQLALPLVWEPVDRRLPEPVAAADVLSAGRPAEYRSLGLALLTMQAARHRAAWDRVLDAIVARMTAMATAGAAAPELDDRLAAEAPDALSADDAAFTERFRQEVTPVLPALPVARTVSVLRGSGDTPGTAPDGGDPHPDQALAVAVAVAVAPTVPLSAELLPELGRRILLVAPPGAGHTTELARLVRRALDDWTPGRPGAGHASDDATPGQPGAGHTPDHETPAQPGAEHTPDHAPPGQPDAAQPPADRAPGHPSRAVPGSAGAGWAPWGCRIPFVLSARSGALPRLDGMVPTLAPLAAAQEPAGWAARQLRSGRAFLAVDDLDAVPEGNRAAVWEWLLHLLETHPRAPCVIATNGTGVPWSRLGDDFRVVGLRPLAPDDTRALLNASAASPGDRQALDVLLPRFDTDPLLVGVADRPAAAAALLRAAGSVGRPERVPRHRLLRAAVSAVWRRPREETTAPPVPGLAANQVPDSVLRAASGRLAVAALGLDCSRIPLRTALSALREPGISHSASSERLLAALADRAGVVFRPGPDTVAFPNPEVRTFLAAHHLAHTPGTDTDELLRAHPSAELGELLRQLRAVEAGTGTVRSVLAAPGGPPRRLSAGSPPPRPAVRRADVRSSAELRALLRAGTAVPELRCSGTVDGLAEALPRLPGLRSLVLSDDPSLVALPELAGCRSLRSLRLLRCPNLRDLTALESSAVMFLDIDPWPNLPVPDDLRRTRWLSRVDLVTGGPRPRQGAVPAQLGAVFPEIRIRRRLHG